MKNILIMGGVGLAVFMLARNFSGGTFTTAGEKIILQNKDGFIVDQRGRVWV